jgi:hypothetical protein
MQDNYKPTYNIEFLEPRVKTMKPFPLRAGLAQSV